MKVQAKTRGTRQEHHNSARRGPWDDKRQYSRPSTNDKRCCGVLHDPRQCPFKDKNCFQDGKKGHTRKMCFQKNQWNVKKIECESGADDGYEYDCAHTIFVCCGQGRG